ncbi:S-layer protein domain-containing protein [uncultured Methanomethylovorans sp.]|uniref:S-layer protein domain-containing protein n=1 Tax=uncultured Methanomethylovorans sp. TaxID=183759 RepID=UPI00374A0EEC
MWIDKHLSPLLLFLALFALVTLVVPVQAVLIVEDVLVNDSSIYLLTGNTWHFYQGYNLSIKGVNQEADSVWFELSLGDKILKSQILDEGDSFTYQKNNRTIFNITINTIYAGDGEELVAFAPVFQYMDGDLPAPIIRDDEIDEEQNSSLVDNVSIGTNWIEGFTLVTALPVSIIAAALISMLGKKGN